jgi:hypothetical protein
VRRRGEENSSRGEKQRRGEDRKRGGRKVLNEAPPGKRRTRRWARRAP